MLRFFKFQNWSAPPALLTGGTFRITGDVDNFIPTHVACKDVSHLLSIWPKGADHGSRFGTGWWYRRMRFGIDGSYWGLGFGAGGWHWGLEYGSWIIKRCLVLCAGIWNWGWNLEINLFEFFLIWNCGLVPRAGIWKKGLAMVADRWDLELVADTGG